MAFIAEYEIAASGRQHLPSSWHGLTWSGHVMPDAMYVLCCSMWEFNHWGGQTLPGGMKALVSGLNNDFT